MTAPIQDYSKVSLLLPMSGANNGTTFTDYSPTPKTITRYGDTKTVTAQSKYYGSSAYFDGNGDYLSVGHVSDLSFGTSDFTIAFWLKWDFSTQPGDFSDFLAKGNGGGTIGAWGLFGRKSNGTATFRSNGGTTDDVSFPSADDQWHHYCVTRASGVLFSFFSGVLIDQKSSSVNYSETSPVTVARHATSVSDFSGYLQDVLLIKGLAAWTENFTPPTRLIGSISTDAANPILDDTGTPAIRSIVAFPRTYPSKLVTTTSASDGSFALSGLPATDYSVVYLDDNAGTLHNDIVHRVIPA